jgi:serine/threonine-protein kinase PknG
VYFDLPGEIAPKLALGMAAEISGNLDLAIHMYDLVSRTDSNYISATFGLARCFRSKGDRKAAVGALDRIPQSSATFVRSRVEAARILIGLDESNRRSSVPDVADLEAASILCDSLVLEGANRYILHQAVLTSALDCLLLKKNRAAVKGKKILGSVLDETHVRLELERSLRTLARMNNGDERIRLIDEANQMRPRTLI